jgi:predicted alpha/beta-hydrolase family hydrolase
MSRFVPLLLKTHDGHPLPHTFFEGDGAGLLVILPGLHYSSDGPLLYLLAKQLQGAGWDTLGLMYGFQALMSFPWTEHVAETLSETTDAIRAAIDHRAYSRVAIAGKSLGSMLLAQLCAPGVVPEDARVAHLTPPIGNATFDAVFASTRQPAYIAIGTADSFYSGEAVASLKARRSTLIRIVEGADHGMDVPGNLAASLRAVGQVVHDVETFFLTGEIAGLEGPASPAQVSSL